MKAKEALRQVIELSDFRGDAKDYEGFIEYVKWDNGVAAEFLAHYTQIKGATARIDRVVSEAMGR